MPQVRFETWRLPVSIRHNLPPQFQILRRPPSLIIETTYRFSKIAWNRTIHCALTGPLFLIAGIVFLLSGERWLHMSEGLLWTIVLIGTVMAVW